MSSNGIISAVTGGINDLDEELEDFLGVVGGVYLHFATVAMSTPAGSMKKRVSSNAIQGKEN